MRYRPAPPAARDVEPDPLRLTALIRRFAAPSPASGRRTTDPLSRVRERVAEGRVRALAPGTNLFEESRVRAAVEQLRFAFARTSPFDWIIRRWSAYGDDATIRALLETYARIGM